MDCPECSTPVVAFPVDEHLRGALPGDEAGAGVCPRCLRLHPVGEPPAEPDSFAPLGNGFPQEPDAAVPMAIMVGLLSSLALHRARIADLIDVVEREGVDPLLVVDRLADEPTVESHVDLRRRRRQLEQLVE